MSDKMRWRYEDTNPVVAAVDAATVIEIGDLVYQETDDVRPASSQDDLGSETANQEMFSDKFLGVAMQRSQAGETAPVRVATTGVFEFDCPSGKFELGDLIGPEQHEPDEAVCALQNQRVQKVDSAYHAIGRVARREGSDATSVLVAIRSTVMTGGVKGSSPSGAKQEDAQSSLLRKLEACLPIIPLLVEKLEAVADAAIALLCYQTDCGYFAAINNLRYALTEAGYDMKLKGNPVA